MLIKEYDSRKRREEEKEKRGWGGRRAFIPGLGCSHGTNCHGNSTFTRTTTPTTTDQNRYMTTYDSTSHSRYLNRTLSLCFTQLLPRSPYQSPEEDPVDTSSSLFLRVSPGLSQVLRARQHNISQQVPRQDSFSSQPHNTTQDKQTTIEIHSRYLDNTRLRTSPSTLEVRQHMINKTS